VVLARQFSELLQKTLNAYHNRAIATQEVIEELIALAKQLSEANQRGEKLGLSEEEVAFHDALATNDSAKKVMGDTKLRVIATDLVTMVRKNVRIDWTLRESAQARMRMLVMRVLNKFGYPPDLQDAAVQEVLAQAARLCADWAIP
jgi:type I restriction enzyme R subunit